MSVILKIPNINIYSDLGFTLKNPKIEINEEISIYQNVQLLPELVSENLIKVLMSQSLLYDASDDPFQSSLNLMKVKKIDEENKISRNIDKFIFNTSKKVENEVYECHNLVLDFLYIIINEEFDLETKRNKLRAFFNENKDIDIKYFLIIYLIYQIEGEYEKLEEVVSVIRISYDQKLENFLMLTNFLENNIESYNLENLKNVANVDFTIRKLSELIHKTYINYLDEIKVQNEYFNNFVKISEEFNTIKRSNIYKKLESKVIETHTILNIKFTSTFDIYEIFNNFVPNRIIPYCNINDFNKILSDYRVPNNWIEKLVGKKKLNTLTFYILNMIEESNENKINPDSKNYFTCILNEVNNNNNIFDFELTIELTNNKITEDTKDFIILKVFQNIELFNSKDNFILNITENIYRGVIMYGLNKILSYVDIPIIQHYFLLDDFASYFLKLEQQYTIDRKRGGEPLYLYVDGNLDFIIPNKNMLDIYNEFDSKLILSYDKKGKDSKTKLNFPNTFQENKESVADVLIYRYTSNRIDIRKLKGIIDVITCYISDKNRIESIKKEYEFCLRNF